MKNIWKWILGIVIALAVVALVAAPFVLHNVLGYSLGPRMIGTNPGWNGPMARGFDSGRHPIMGGRGFAPLGMGFMFFGMFFRALIPLGVLALAVYGGIHLFSRPKAQPTVMEAAPTPTHACPKCGKAVQDNWNNCPYCGKKQ